MSARSIDGLRAQVTEAGGRFGLLAEGFDQAARIHSEYVDEVDAIRVAARRVSAGCAEAIGQAQQWCHLTVEQAPQAFPYAASFLVAPPVFALPVEAQYAGHRWAGAAGAVEDFRNQWNALTVRRVEADMLTARRLEQIEVVRAIDSAVPSVSLGQASGVQASVWAGDAAAITAAGLVALGSAAAVRQVWDTLSPAQKDALVRSTPRVIGNLDGIPLGYRAKANETNIRAEISRLQARLAEIDAELDYPPGSYAMAGSSPHADLTGERHDLLAAIAGYETYLAVPEGVERFWFDADGMPQVADRVHVVAFDPDGPSIATYHGVFDDAGDIPDWVGNVAVHVPGTGTLMERFHGTDERAYNLYWEANQDKRGAEPTAVIAWADGAFPQKAQAASDKYTVDMAPRLRDFTAAIDTHPETSTLTVTGHSYGSAVVGKAEQAGLRADRVLYVAPAGMGSGVEDLGDYPHTRQAPHYTLMARNDGVVGLIQGADAGSLGHGASPLTAKGVTRLETGWLDAEDPTSGTVESLGPFKAHSGVYEKGSTAFNNIVEVITGGEATTYAPDDELPAPQGGRRRQPGIHAGDYEPEYTSIQ
ncbi:alpha/beta hydrolase [Isoptericola croceus]|uniref:alpha/beta hydrolase n=1 Tax=Isoptericola croceus TaxID=3031406 RepID=UPI0023F753DE|nr:alpha/beta hydrolase [Isoptericola croceus]